jgi:hypothetical protein
MAAALSVMTLLSGCDTEDDGVVLGSAWMPVMPGVVVGTAGVSTTGADASGQASTGAVQ